MKIHELQKDSTILDWFDNLNPSENTRKHYLMGMQVYTEFTGMTPKELIDESEAEIKAGVSPRERKIKKYLIRFRKHLTDSELADKTRHGYFSAVRSFYNSFEIDLPKLMKSGQVITVKEENLPIPTKEELQDVLQVCDPQEKALILVGVSSGLAANEICRLKVKDFKTGYHAETKVTTLKVRRQKVKFDFITFLSPEASKAVQDYLDYRNRETKDTREARINQLEKQRVFSDNDFLFCKQNVSDSYLKSKNDKERQLTHGIFMKIYRTISEKAGKNSTGDAWNIIRSHNMRRYFNSALLNAGCDSFHVDYFMGHKQNETQAAYFRASPEKLREIYQKYVPFLTIQKALDISESQEYQQIKHENQILAAETARHVVERKELQDMRIELNEMREFEKIFQSEISRLRENFENPKTDGDKAIIEHKKRMAHDADYRDEFNRNNITLKKKETKEINNEDYRDPRYWDYEVRG